MNRTKIPWVINPDGTQGYTLNPVTGKCPIACRNPEGKIYCFNHKRINRFHLDPIPKFHPEVLDEAEMKMIARKHPMGIFLCSTFEWLWNEEWAKEIYYFCKAWEVCPDVRFYLLTKRPQDLTKWSPFPEKCWVGFTATTDKQLQYGLAYIADIEAWVKYISFEPLFEPVIFLAPEIVDWIIIGSQTQPIRHPKREWVEEIIQAADRARIPIFVKEPLASHYQINRKEWPR